MSTSTKGLLATLLIVSTLTLGACQKQKQSSVQAEQPKISQNNQTKAAQDQNGTIVPDAWVVADNEIFIPVVDKLGEHLRQARQDYLKGDNIAAALAMRKGSAFLKQELPQADSKSKTAINKASEELIKNAALVESDEIASVKELDQVFAKVYQANIEHLWIVADEQEWIPIEDKANLEMAQKEINAVKDSMGSPNEALSRNLSNAIATISEQITNLNQNLAQS